MRNIVSVYARRFVAATYRCKAGSDWPMCHCAMAHGPLLGHQMGPRQLLFNFRICKHSKMFKTDYQAVRNENKRDRMGMIWNFELFTEAVK